MSQMGRNTICGCKKRFLEKAAFAFEGRVGCIVAGDLAEAQTETEEEHWEMAKRNDHMRQKVGEKGMSLSDRLRMERRAQRRVLV
jgi:hypothetical protein